MTAKYRNKPVVTEEGRFDSQKEYERWCHLKFLEKIHCIKALRRQVPFYFGNEKDGYVMGASRKLSYVADHVYIDLADAFYGNEGTFIVEDVKGFRTDAYKIKKALMKYFHNVDIKEI